MNDNQKFDADVAAMMRSSGDLLKAVVNGKIAENIAAIVSSEPNAAAEREEAYGRIRCLKDFLASLENSVLYDEQRRAAEAAATDL